MGQVEHELPLRAPVQHSAAIMVNLLGDLWFAPNGVRAQASAQAVSPPWAQVLALPGTHLHLYGKLSARPGRVVDDVAVDLPRPRAFAMTSSERFGILKDRIWQHIRHAERP